jgi:hypothetical protein
MVQVMPDTRRFEDAIDAAFTRHLKTLFDNLAISDDHDEAEKRFSKGFQMALDAHARAMRIVKGLVQA